MQYFFELIAPESFLGAEVTFPVHTKS